MLFVGVVVILVVLIYIKYIYDMKALKLELKKSSSVVKLSACTVEYYIKGTGHPVIISHGGAGGYDQGLITADVHLQSNFMIIAVSRFGHLQSNLPDNPSAQLQADIYKELLDHLELENAAVIGTSGGGPSALQFALRHPTRCSALVLSCAVSQYLPKRNMKAYEHPFTYYMMIKYFKAFVLKQIGVDKVTYSKLNDSEKKGLDKLFHVMNPIELRREGLYLEVEEWADKEVWESRYDLKEVIVPTLIIHAVDDLVVPYIHAKDAHEKITDSILLSLPDGGHLKLGHKDSIKEETSMFISKSF